MPNLFPRKCSLVIADDDGMSVDLGGLSARFEVYRPGLDDNSIGITKITIWNLSGDTLSRITTKNAQIRIDAGYPDRFGTIFSGQVRHAHAYWQGPDRVVEIYAKDGGIAIESARANHSFADGTSVRAIVRALAATMDRVGVGPLEEVPERPIVGSRVFSGMTRDALDQLSRDYGFRWQIVQGILQTIERKREPGGPALVISRDTGMIGSPISLPSGIDVTTLLDPGLIPGRRVDVVTAGALVAASPQTLSASIDLPAAARAQQGGRFDVVRLAHIGETRGQLWYTKFFALAEGLL